MPTINPGSPDLPPITPGTEPGSANAINSTTAAPPPDTTPPPPGTVSYVATVAECTNPVQPDPALCEATTGINNLNVDLQDSTSGLAHITYLRFDLDAKISGKTVTALTLRLVATNEFKADSSNSGEVWQVTPFNLSDLSSKVPSKVGSTALAGDLGAVVQNQTMDWKLPVTIATPNAPVYLGVYPTTDDGVNYWNSKGLKPPTLIIDYN